MDAAKLGALSVVADAREGLIALAAALEGHRVAPEYAAQIARLRAEWDAAVDSARAPTDSLPPSQGSVIGAVNDAVGDHATVICAAGSLPGDLLRLWRSRDARSYHVEYGYSCMGYEIPAGIGVQLADPARRTVVMVGDGSYLMLNSELVTAVAENLNLTVVLIDNRAYMSIRGLQMECGSPSFNNELRRRDPRTGRTNGELVPLDFVKQAQGLGAQALKAESLDELRRALADAERLGGVQVIVVPVNLRERVPGFESWWDVPIAAVSTQSAVQQRRAEYEEQRSQQIRYFSAGPGSRPAKKEQA